VALAIAYARKTAEVGFQQNYKVVWGNRHVFFLQHGREVQLSIDKTSGLYNFMHVKGLLFD